MANSEFKMMVWRASEFGSRRSCIRHSLFRIRHTLLTIAND